MALPAILILISALQGATPNPAAFMRATYGVTESEMATADLNGDGRDEVIVRATSPDHCGSGGCDLFVLTPKGDSFRTVMEATVTHVPVRALQTRTNGWKDLAVTVAGGGIRTPRQVRMRFDGRSYPDNPTVVHSDDVSALEGEVLLSDIVTIPM